MVFCGVPSLGRYSVASGEVGRPRMVTTTGNTAMNRRPGANLRILPGRGSVLQLKIGLAQFGEVENGIHVRSGRAGPPYPCIKVLNDGFASGRILAGASSEKRRTSFGRFPMDLLRDDRLAHDQKGSS